MATIKIWMHGEEVEIDRLEGLKLVMSRTASLTAPETAAMSADVETASEPAPKKAKKAPAKKAPAKKG